jgi:hypothetical protein
MTQAAAESLAQQIYTLTRGRPGYGNGIEVGYGQILNRGHQPVHPASLRENRMVRVHGVVDDMTGAPYTDIVIGDVKIPPGQKTATINPVGMPANNPEDALAELFEGTVAA